MVPTNGADVVRLAPGVVVRDLGTEVALLDEAEGTLHVVAGEGVDIVRAIGSAPTLAALALASGRPADVVRATVAELQEAGVVLAPALVSRRSALRTAAKVGAGVAAIPVLSSIRLPSAAAVQSPIMIPIATGTQFGLSSSMANAGGNPNQGGFRFLDSPSALGDLNLALSTPLLEVAPGSDEVRRYAASANGQSTPTIARKITGEVVGTPGPNNRLTIGFTIPEARQYSIAASFADLRNSTQSGPVGIRIVRRTAAGIVTDLVPLTIISAESTDAFPTSISTPVGNTAFTVGDSILFIISAQGASSAVDTAEGADNTSISITITAGPP